jgi:hypothetical protein
MDRAMTFVGILFALGCIAFIVTMLREIARTPDHMFRSGSRSRWTLAVIFYPILGSALYALKGRPRQGM